MKFEVVQKKQKFTPITVTFTIESEEELRQVVAELGSVAGDFEWCNHTYPLYDKLDNERIALGLPE